MKHYSLKEGQWIFEQDQLAKSYYVLISGLLEVSVNQKKVN